MTRFIFDDGGRKAAGYSGSTGDCVVRAIAIAAQLPYRQVYDALYEKTQEHADTRRDRAARHIRRRSQRASPRNGTNKAIYRPYIESLGWTWHPTMQIGSGCQTHLKSEELPKGRLIVRCSKHLVAVVDGVIHDTHDSSRAGTRCVYGYYRKD